MQYDIQYMDSVFDDLALIKRYQFYDSTWPRVADEIEHHIGFLREIPRGFPLYPGSESYRKLVAGDYIVLYKVFDERHVVEIHAIWHGKKNIAEIIDTLPK